MCTHHAEPHEYEWPFWVTQWPPRMVIANYMPTPAKEFFANLCLKFNYTRAQCACLASIRHLSAGVRRVVRTLVARKSALSFVHRETVHQRGDESKTIHTRACPGWWHNDKKVKFTSTQPKRFFLTELFLKLATVNSREYRFFRQRFQLKSWPSGENEKLLLSSLRD